MIYYSVAERLNLFVGQYSMNMRNTADFADSNGFPVRAN